MYLIGVCCLVLLVIGRESLKIFAEDDYPAGNYLFKVNHRNTRTRDSRKRCEICSKVTTKTPERRHWRRSGGESVPAPDHYNSEVSRFIQDYIQEDTGKIHQRIENDVQNALKKDNANVPLSQVTERHGSVWVPENDDPAEKFIESLKDSRMDQPDKKHDNSYAEKQATLDHPVPGHIPRWIPEGLKDVVKQYPSDSDVPLWIPDGLKDLVKSADPRDKKQDESDAEKHAKLADKQFDIPHYLKQKVQKDLLADDINAVKSDFNMLESDMTQRHQNTKKLSKEATEGHISEPPEKKEIIRQMVDDDFALKYQQLHKNDPHFGVTDGGMKDLVKQDSRDKKQDESDDEKHARLANKQYDIPHYLKQKVQKDLLADDMNAVKSDFNMLESDMTQRHQNTKKLSKEEKKEIIRQVVDDDFALKYQQLHKNDPHFGVTDGGMKDLVKQDSRDKKQDESDDEKHARLANKQYDIPHYLKQKVQKDLLADDMNAVKSDFNMLESNMAQRDQDAKKLSKEDKKEIIRQMVDDDFALKFQQLHKNDPRFVAAKDGNFGKPVPQLSSYDVPDHLKTKLQDAILNGKQEEIHKTFDAIASLMPKKDLSKEDKRAILRQVVDTDFAKRYLEKQRKDTKTYDVDTDFKDLMRNAKPKMDIPDSLKKKIQHEMLQNDVTAVKNDFKILEDSAAALNKQFPREDQKQLLRDLVTDDFAKKFTELHKDFQFPSVPQDSSEQTYDKVPDDATIISIPQNPSTHEGAAQLLKDLENKDYGRLALHLDQALGIDKLNDMMNDPSRRGSVDQDEKTKKEKLRNDLMTDIFSGKEQVFKDVVNHLLGSKTPVRQDTEKPAERHALAKDPKQSLLDDLQDGDFKKMEKHLDQVLSGSNNKMNDPSSKRKADPLEELVKDKLRQDILSYAYSGNDQKFKDAVNKLFGSDTKDQKNDPQPVINNFKETIMQDAMKHDVINLVQDMDKTEKVIKDSPGKQDAPEQGYAKKKLQILEDSIEGDREKLNKDMNNFFSR